MRWRDVAQCGPGARALMPETPPLLVALRGLLPPDVAAGWADPQGAHPLLPGEDLPGATPARLREFAAGRAAVRAALAALGLPAMSIAHGKDRAPVWPVGVTGSITHTGTQCLAVVARDTVLRGIGVDLEPAVPLDRDLWDTILLPDEQRALMRLPPDQRGLAAKTAFSAKEAAYKAQYARSKTLFGFEVMHLTQTDDQFTARFRDPVPPFAAGDWIDGRIAVTAGHILTLAHF